MTTTIDARRVLDRLPAEERSRIGRFDVFDTIGSTSTWLMGEPPPAPGQCRIAAADRQTAGRGRRDNRWLSPAGAGLWLSMAYTFEKVPRRFSALTLAVGVDLAAALNALGAEVRLKWPNDLMAGARKLGGILTEAQSQAGRRTVVVGVGLNVALPAGLREAVAETRGAEVTDLTECLGTVPPADELAAVVVHALVSGIARFAEYGPGANLGAFGRFDWLAGRRIVAEHDAGRIAGTASGIDEDGALLIRAGGRLERLVSGSVRLQESPDAVP